MVSIQSNRIEPKGRIHIGQELELLQKAERPQAETSFFEAGRPQGLPAIDYTRHVAGPGELPTQRLSYSLIPAKGEVFIEDDGLCASYGIFGAPGSGKTHLLMYLLHQLLKLNADDQESKFGALILDPKAALMKDVQEIVEKAGRKDDLEIINTDLLIETEKSINVIDTSLESNELGKQLVLAAQSAGVATSDPYWLMAWGNIFGAAHFILNLDDYVVNLRELTDAVLTKEKRGGVTKRRIEFIAEERKEKLDQFPKDLKQDTEQAINQMENFFSQENENIPTIEVIINQAYSYFQRSRYNCYSQSNSKRFAKTRPNMYDQIIEDGKIILVSLSPNEPAVAKTLCTLVKCLFQRSVLSRLERFNRPPSATDKLKNFKRPLIIACDEYSQVASEVPGQPMGDGDFFSQARQQGCMGILATQSVNVLQASSLKENWRSIFSNFGAKIFMRLVDNETTEEATKLAGDSDWYISSLGTSRGKEGLSSSSQKQLQQRKSLPSVVLTQVLQKGDAIILGSLNGSKGQSTVRFVHVPKDIDSLPQPSKDRNA